MPKINVGDIVILDERQFYEHDEHLGIVISNPVRSVRPGKEADQVDLSVEVYWMGYCFMHHYVDELEILYEIR